MRSLAGLVFLLTLLPLAGTTVASALGLISPVAANLVRATCHLGLSVIIVANLILRRIRAAKEKISGRLAWAWGPMSFPLLVALPALSGLYNQIDMMEASRILVSAVFSSNVLFLYPLMIFVMARFKGTSDYFACLTKMYVLFAVALCVLASALYVSGHSPYTRIGYPFQPGVFAYYILVAWSVSAIFRQNVFLNLFFAAHIIASGSRSAVILLFMLFLFGTKTLKLGRRVILIAALLGVMLLLYLANGQFLRPYLVERDDLSSGRFSIWAEALSQLREVDVLLFGRGSPQEIVRADELEEETWGTHNSFLDLTLSYGLPYALIAYLVWLIHFFPKQPANGSAVYRLQVSLFLLVSAKSLITNTFWLNMGDAATFFVLLVLPCPASRATHTVSARRRYKSRIKT